MFYDLLIDCNWTLISATGGVYKDSTAVKGGDGTVTAGTIENGSFIKNN